MEQLFDLPAHPFLVHLPVVLVPACALAALLLALRPAWRRRYGAALAVATLLGAVAVIVAAGSGEALNDALEDRIGDLAAEHRSLGEATRLLSIMFFAATAAMAGFDRWSSRAAASDGGSTNTLVDRREAIGWGLVAVTVVLGALATVWIIRTGHEGARIVWTGVLPEDG